MSDDRKDEGYGNGYTTVPFTKFGKTRDIPLRIFEGGKPVKNPEPRWDAVLWVEVGEDWYALRDRRTLVVERADFVAAETRQIADEMLAEHERRYPNPE